MKGWGKKFFNKTLIRYLSVGYLSTILNVSFNLLTIKYLSSFDLGRVTIGKSIFQSYEFAHFGIRFGIDRHLPEETKDKVRNAIFSVGFWSSLVFSIVFTVFWALYQFDDPLFYSCFYIAGNFYTITTIYRAYYRVAADKTAFIRISLLLNVLPIAIQIVGLFLFGMHGLLISHLSSYAIVYFICARAFNLKPSNIRQTFTSIFPKLFFSGYLLFFSSVMSYLSTVGDRFLIAKADSMSTVGYFSVIMFFFGLFNIVSVSYSELILDKIIKEKNFLFCLKHMGIVSFLISIFVATVYFLAPLLVQWFLPKYTSIVPGVVIISIGAVPYAGLSILNFYLHAIDRRVQLLLVNTICTSLYFGGLIILLKDKSFTITDIVLLKLGFFCLLFFLTLSAGFFYSKKHKKN